MSFTYLDIRVAFALAKIECVTDWNNDASGSVLANEHGSGYRDRAASSNAQLPAPVYFVDEASLVEAWKHGVATSDKDQERAGVCAFCFRTHNLRQCPRL